MPKDLTKLARGLRKHSTQVEKILWHKLRSKQLQGVKFRRQQPIGPYVVDFVCFEEKLVIELDGGQHAARKKEDAERDVWLGTRGFKVLRFWNHQVLESLEGVIDVISLTW
ncbi:MAG: endonuclease domain-containing protein [Desulfobacteraceae bacterium]|nr:MAG: endonuclease domain-containing protein [Desulfobacteraceae bacterium]